MSAPRPGDPCNAAVPLDGGGWHECGAPSAAVMVYACVHEHVVTKAVCAGCQAIPGETGCRRCWDLGHECMMTAAPATMGA